MELPSALAYFIGFVLIVGVVLFLVNSFLFPQMTSGVSLNKTLSDYISANLKGDYLSKQPVNDINSTLFTSSWSVGNTNFTGLLSKNSNGNGIKKISIIVESPDTVNDMNLTLVGKYFKGVGSNWRCQTGTEAIVCENFVNGTNKVGKDVIILPGKTIIISCVIPRESELYRFNTCLIN